MDEMSATADQVKEMLLKEFEDAIDKRTTKSA
jgi:hypothetical protein